MEQLLHYVWQHRIFPLGTLHTDQGQVVEVIDPGLHNTDAGPDFFNAKIRLDGQLWVGNVEIHLRATDWYRHHHETDIHYNNVVLHVVETLDGVARNAAGNAPPQLQLPIPDTLRSSFEALQQEAQYPPCHKVIPDIPALHIHSWLDALARERLQQKTERIERWLAQTTDDWERTFFITLARAFGFGKNTDAFELWAATIDPQHIGKHRDNPMQVEAFFFGQAGLLDEHTTPPERQDEHFHRLQQEYRFLQKKFNLTPISYAHWRFLRLRPQNFPHRRLAQLALLYSTAQLNFSKIKTTDRLEEVRKLLKIKTIDYWSTHYRFGEKVNKTAKYADKSKIETSAKTDIESEVTPQQRAKRAKTSSTELSDATIDLLLINAVIPILFSYGRRHSDETFTERAIEWLESIAPEQNAIVREWKRVDITAQHAADSQALLHLKTRYCDRRDCLRCRLGSFYLRHQST